MATYKVIQDIEAEDKLLGPLTLRQFIYAALVVIMGFIAFKLAIAKWFLALPFIPPIVFFATLAAPFGHDQSNEVWLLAKIRFALKPRRRIWDQSGLKELVTVTAPKHVERHLTNGLDQAEVRSRLSALANTIDSRGWAVKNINVNLFSQPSYVLNQLGSDRLIDPSTIPQEVPNFDAGGLSDIMDEETSPTAQHIDQMIVASEQTHRQQAIEKMQQSSQNTQMPAGAPNDYWFMHQPDPGTVPQGYATFSASPVVVPGTKQPSQFSSGATTADEQALLEQIHAQKSEPKQNYHHLKIIDPMGKKNIPAAPAKKILEQNRHIQGTTMDNSKAARDHSNPVILKLAHNDDLSVATLARQANKAPKQPPDNEVVVSLR